MRLNRYRRFVESDSYGKLKGMLEGIEGFQTVVDEEGELLILTVKVGGTFELESLQSLFSQIAVIEEEFPDVTWLEDGDEIIFQFYI